MKTFRIDYQITNKEGNFFESSKLVEASDTDYAEYIFTENSFPLGNGREEDELNEQLRKSLNILSIEEEEVAWCINRVNPQRTFKWYIISVSFKSLVEIWDTNQ